MMPIKQSIAGIYLLAIAFCGLGAQSTDNQGPTQTVQASLDWQTKQLTVRITGSAQIDTKNRLSQVARQERELRNLFSEYIGAALNPIQVDSRRSVETIAKSFPDFEQDLRDLVDSFVFVGTQPRSDLQGVSASWRLDLFPYLADKLNARGLVEAVPAPRPWSAQVPMTAIVIYATEPISWFGMNQSAHLVPALFPELLDSSMQVLFKPNLVGSKLNRQLGAIRYLSEADLKNRRDELGTNPFYVRARFVYGVQPTNPVISAEDSAIIRSSRYAQNLLEQGRIFIVISDNWLRQDYEVKP